MERVSLPDVIWDHEVVSADKAPPDFIWHGWIARGNVTLLTSMWKAGKTTLVSLLLSRRKQGGPLAGLAVKPGKTIIITEEHASLWADRARRYDFGGNVCFMPRPFLSIPTLDQWRTLIDRILHLHMEHNFDLLVIDPLAPFLHSENHAHGILEALLPCAS